MGKRLILAGLALAMAVSFGCVAPIMWINPNVSHEEAQRLLAKCQYEVNSTVYGAGDPFLAVMESRNLFAQCMRANGFAPQRVR